MGKTIILNLLDIKLKGDVLDIGESYGVIYNISKDIEEELAIDFIESESSLKEETHDTCTMFFSLSSIWRDSIKEKLINDISKFIKKDGEIYIWDINKEIGSMFNNKIRAVLPSGKFKEFEFKNLNPMMKSNIDITKELIKDKFTIKEEKVWEDIYFIKAIKN